MSEYHVYWTEPQEAVYAVKIEAESEEEAIKKARNWDFEGEPTHIETRELSVVGVYRDYEAELA